MTSSFINKNRHEGCEILIRGTVQGVGFRPFVYNLASRFGISGTVSNTGDGVHIRAAARSERLAAFLAAIKSEAPPLARITDIKQQPLHEPVVPGVFTILTSAEGEAPRAVIPPDIALCDDCLKELLNPADHRYRYPFINCTNCGPRFTIVESIPYDRPKTSMKAFRMCKVCTREYTDPANRRFHAQPNACSDCGPRLFWHERSGRRIEGVVPLAEAAVALSAGQVVALRGLGGFHLSVDARNRAAVDLLRARKNRPDKPLAVMLPNMTSIRRFCPVGREEEELLRSTIHPIVLLRKRIDFALADNLAPGCGELGVMLPYTPLHHLLFRQPGCPEALVMTSGNASGAPICTANEDALRRLGHIADFFLLHNRDIVTRIDDSVTRITSGRPQIFRRARGYVPQPVEIPWHLPPVLGCGAGLKSTFCLGRDTSVFPSQHIGDLFNLESYEFYTESIEHLQRVLRIEPQIAVCDLHPDYMSSHYAAELGLPLYRVQHHHAHAVAVMAEHSLSEPALAVVLDGTGYGPDGTIWGGEVLLAELTRFKRLAHLEQLPLPGGDAAATQPWRMGMAALFAAAGGAPWPEERLPAGIAAIDTHRRSTINAMLAKGFNSPLTSSCGRLFDAMAALLDVRQHISYEGQAAIEFEWLARARADANWLDRIPQFSQLERPALLCKKGEKWEISSTEFVTLALAALAVGATPGEVALQFHCQLLAVLTELLRRLADRTGVRQVVLAGGCMQNRLLLEGLLHTIPRINLEVFTGESLPINDGGIALGQTIIGGLQHVSRNPHEGHQS